MPDRPLVLQDALLSSPDGLVQQQNRLWFHFQKYPWSLDSPDTNPSSGDHQRLLQQMVEQREGTWTVDVDLAGGCFSVFL